jgi:hypothetical protein
MKKAIVISLLAAAAAVTLSSCLAVAAGAAVGYGAHKEGYRLQNPLTKD